jgi:cold-inducible RNA-binding protein
VAKRLFVGNLPFATTDDQLREIFTRIGPCDSASVVTDRVSGRSRGFGFVEMSSDDDASRAVTELDGSDYSGRKLTVSAAHERPSGGGGGGGRSR